MKKGVNKLVKSSLLRLFVSSQSRGLRCVSEDVACTCAFLLHSPPDNPRLTVCVSEGSEAERSDRGYLRSREERESDCTKRRVFLESRGRELEERKVAWGLQGLLWIISSEH